MLYWCCVSAVSARSQAHKQGALIVSHGAERLLQRRC